MDRSANERGSAAAAEEYRGFPLLALVVALAVMVALAWFAACRPSGSAASGGFAARALTPIRETGAPEWHQRAANRRR